LVECQHDALANAADGADRLPHDGIDWWIDGSKNEGTCELDALETPADDMMLERFEVDDDVRKFRQN